jgi:hypothetical protein
METQPGGELVSNNLRREKARNGILRAIAYATEDRSAKIVVENQGIGASVGKKKPISTANQRVP